MEKVAERAGFSSPRHMRRVWAEYHDHAPSQERRAAGLQKKSAPTVSYRSSLP